MADISITPANVVSVSGNTEAGTAGETLTAGQTVYKKSSDSKFYKADCDATAVGAQTGIDDVYGIALNGASASQPVTVQKTGVITIGGTVTIGSVQYQSNVAGGITETWADIASTDYVTIIGVATSAANITLGIVQSGVAKP